MNRASFCLTATSRSASVRLFATAIALTVAFGAAPAGAQTGPAGRPYYYSDSRRIELEPSADRIAVRVAPGSESAFLAAHPEIDPGSVELLRRHRLALYRLAGGLSAGQRTATRSAVAASPLVQLAPRVFEAPGALMLVTDEIIVRFAPGASAETVTQLATDHGTEVLEKVWWAPDTYRLRTVGRDGLDTANALHERADVVFSHPDFVRVAPRRPTAVPAAGERLVFDLEYDRLPADTLIPPGSTGFAVVEPAAATLPRQTSSASVPDTSALVGRTPLKNEDFEGAFPNTWTLYGDPTWGDDPYRPHAGAWSGYCVGSSVWAPGPYPNDVNGWMVYGPFSLADATDARATVQSWIRTEADHDYFKIMASTNGSNFYGWVYSGNWASTIGGDGWINLPFDFKDVYTLGDLRGQPQVWLALIFQSDAANAFDYEGVYVDDVVVEKITGGYESITSDSYDHLQWSLANNEQSWGTAGADISALSAWSVTHGSDAIKIAIIDTGVDLTHPDLAAKMLPGYDATGGGSGGAATGDDSHGTGCAGIAAAVTDNGLGVAGVARAARIIPVRFGYNGPSGLITQDSWIADAINWAVAQGADVLSNSWGGGYPATVINNAFVNAKTNGRGGKGAVVVVATGNSNGVVSYPANLDYVLAVGATSPCDERISPTSCDAEPWGSCYGPEVDIVAPGVMMYTTDLAGTPGSTSGDYMPDFNGTSSATPVVAGVAALLLGLDPTLTATEVETRLLATADDVGAPGWDQETGFGRVNAYRAVSEIPSGCYQLTLTHSGFGIDPAPSHPSSPGCPAGWYRAGRVVGLTADPDSFWTVASWSGTNDDASTSTTNSLTMPASPHTATVHYQMSGSTAIVINEVHTGIPNWVELYNGGLDENLTGLELQTTGCAGATLGLPSFVLGAQQYVKVREGSGTSTADTVYLGGDICWSSSGAGSAALVSGGTGIDFVRWGGSTQGPPAGTYWDELSVLPNAGYAMTVGRHRFPADTNSTRDWCCQEESDARANDGCLELTRDIRPGSAFSGPVWQTDVDGVLFFVAYDELHGNELWKSDGTEAGTVLVKDIFPGPADGIPWGVWTEVQPASAGGLFYFWATNGVSNVEPWRSDGTAAGTFMLRNINPNGPSLPINANMVAVGDRVFFDAGEDDHGVELWVTDGSGWSGTTRVADIVSGSTGSFPDSLAGAQGKLYFNADTPAEGREPWISDGTGAGTFRLLDIYSGPTGSSAYGFTQLGDEVVFFAEDPTYGNEPWRTDGTPGGTARIKNVNPGSADGAGYVIGEVNGLLVLALNDGGGFEPWASDGTSAGTQLLADTNSPDSWPDDCASLGRILLFMAGHTSSNEHELWKTDGTPGGTHLVKDFGWGTPWRCVAARGTVFFTADTGSTDPHGEELWRSEGLGSNTVMVEDLNPGWPGSPYGPPVESAGMVFIGSEDDLSGNELRVLKFHVPDELTLTGETYFGFEYKEACTRLSVGPDLVAAAGGFLRLEAGEVVEMHNGFEAAGELVVDQRLPGPCR